VNWESIYRNKVVDAQTAISHVNSGDIVYVGGGAGAPAVLVDALCERAPDLRDVQLVHILTFIGAPYVDPKHEGAFRSNSLFIGHNVRKAVQEGRADFTPIFLSEIPGLFQKKIIPLDASLISVSPPDEHGFCSFGIEVGTTKPAAENSRIIIAEVNRQMPRVLGDSFIHVSRLTHVVEVDYPLPESVQGNKTPANIRIGELIAEMIPDGATLQMGIGGIPDAVLDKLHNHRDLGIHTELFSDGVVSLYEQGIITCSKKTLHPGKMIAGFLFGSQRLYNFVDNNAIVELHPTDYVNDPFRIAQNDNMVAINSALQVDLTGQVCADSIGHMFYSGVGGQVDFIRGSARSKGGLPIVALPSTAKNDTISRISPLLAEGSGVTTSRNDVHYIVTEYGVASLYGKTIRQRACELINIAHPKFRDELTQVARKLGYL